MHWFRFSFSLRTMLVGSAIFAACLGMNVLKAHPEIAYESSDGRPVYLEDVWWYGWPWKCAKTVRMMDIEASTSDQIVSNLIVDDTNWLAVWQNTAVALALCVGVPLAMSLASRFGRA